MAGIEPLLLTGFLFHGHATLKIYEFQITGKQPISPKLLLCYKLTIESIYYVISYSLVLFPKAPV